VRTARARRILDGALLSLLFPLLFLPPLGFVLGYEFPFDFQEYRRLAPMPDWPRTLAELERFPARFEACFNDHFGFRSTLRGLYFSLKYRAGDSPSRQVVIGRDGWLFLHEDAHGQGIGNARHLVQLTDAQLDRFAETLDARRRWLERRGIAYFFMPTPNKETVYREHLPEYFTRVHPRSALDQLRERLRADTQVALVDVEPLLRTRKTDMELYLKTDTHWNLYGAHLAEHALAEAVGKRLQTPLAAVRPAPEQYRRITQPGGDLARLLGLGPVLSDRNLARIDEDPPCARENLEGQDFVILCGGSPLRVVVFRDSFFEAMEPAFSRRFGESAYLWGDLDQERLIAAIERYRPDVVVEQRVERALIKRVPALAAQGGQAWRR
jgi:alginate O-acetyltransferase complex protein AlgJ